MAEDVVNWRCDWSIQKWDEEAVTWLTARLGRTPQAADFEAAGVAPFEDILIPGNLLTTAGLNRMTSLIIGGGGQAADNTHTRLGTGNGVTAVAVGDTDFSAAAGSANRWFQVMDATYPQQSNGLMTFKATFASGDGNYSWQEFGIDVTTGATSSGNTVGTVLLNHKLSNQGTKVAGQSWAATATVTLS